MYKKYFLFGVLMFLGIFLPPTPSHASDIVGATNIQVKQEAWKSGNIGETITGTLTDAGRSDYNSPGTTVTLRYLYDPDASNVDLNSFGYKYYGGTEPVLGTNLEYSTDCTVNANKATVGQPGYNDFTCQTLDQNLNSGIYVFAIGGNGTVTWNSYIDNMDFTITGGATPPATVSPSAQFGSATPVGTTGEDIKVNVFNLTQATTGYLQLGTAMEQGTTAVYTCTPGTITSPAITVPATTGTTPSVIDYTFTNLLTGAYCIRPTIVVLGVTFPAASGSGVDGNGYWTAQGALFAIGTTLVQGATNNPTANPLGCSTPTTGTSVNTGYCLLAPLPGVGDPTTGLLNVSTGIGNYFNAIIKLVMGLIGVLAVLMIVVGGIEYMATVSITEKEGARNRIVNALLGLLIALGSYIILNTINPHLTNLTVSVNQVQVNYTPTADIGLPIPSGTPPMTNGTSPGVATGTSDVKSNNTTYDTVLQNAANAYGVECTWLKATMYRESNGKPGATSGAGAIGLMQMMPSTWNAMGFTDSTKWTDPQTAANASAKFISNLKNSGCNNSPSSSTTDCNVTNNNYVNGYLAAAYNAGAGSNAPSVDCPGKTQWECQINQGGFVETEQYATLVTNNYQVLKQNNWGC